MLKTISPQDAANLMKDGAVLVDIREADEFAREHARQARHHPLSRLGPDAPVDAPGGKVIFTCRTGNRTGCNAETLAEAAQGGEGCEAYILEGGLEAWKKAGLPVAADKSRPIEIIRQVQIAAGSLVVAGAALGALVHPGFYLLSAAVGAGLVFAGVSGTCMMATLLGAMPWNRRARAA